MDIIGSGDGDGPWCPPQTQLLLMKTEQEADVSLLEAVIG